METRKEGDVFIDLECLGTLYGRGDWLSKIDILANELPPALRHEGFSVASVTCFACYKRPRGIVPRVFQTTLRKAAEAVGWKMVWSSAIADASLITAVNRSLASGELSPNVVIITNDHDFIALIRRVRDTGRFVLVSGTQVNVRIQSFANKVVPLQELLDGPQDEKNNRNDVSQPSRLHNPIPLR